MTMENKSYIALFTIFFSFSGFQQQNTMAEKQQSVPLEFRPEGLNKMAFVVCLDWISLIYFPDNLSGKGILFIQYIHKLGVQNEMFVDVYGLTMELLVMVPHPVHAVVVRFPVTDEASASPIGPVQTDGHGLYFIKQAIGNAFGTIAIIHALANIGAKETYEVGTPIKTFLDKTRDMSPQEKAEYLAKDENMRVGEHDHSAQEGKTQAPAAGKKVNMYFATFVHHNGGLYELNGNFDGPVQHGPTSKETLLEDTALVVNKFMDRDSDENDFTVMALVKKE